MSIFPIFEPNGNTVIRKSKLLSVAAVGGILIISAVLVFDLLRNDTELSSKLKDELTFIYYVPSTWRIEPESVMYTGGILSYKAVREQNDTSVNITEQATPEVFTDVPQYYPTLIDRLNRYGSFESKNGTVYLTKPTELKGGQQAVMNTKGTLLFVHPNDDLDDDEWRKLFNGMSEHRPR